ncbi:hypothetical protein V1514DRAFT_319102 [Lipomyces japonicus]|uniref:uncharacterized protein n=1 Tax=Lipomyces japonicus TaxID=56871 RepID=UPI0034D01352
MIDSFMVSLRKRFHSRRSLTVSTAASPRSQQSSLPATSSSSSTLSLSLEQQNDNNDNNRNKKISKSYGDDIYSSFHRRISFISPHTQVIRARIPTPRGQSINVSRAETDKKFASTAGLAVQLSQQVAAEATGAASTATTGIAGGCGLNTNGKKTMQFKWGRGRRTSVDTQHLKPKISELFIPRMIPDKEESLGSAEQQQYKQGISTIMQTIDEPSEDSDQTTELDTDEAIRKIKSIINDSVAELENRQENKLEMRRRQQQQQRQRLSLTRMRGLTMMKIENNDADSFKIALPCPTVLNMLEQSGDLVGIPLATEIACQPASGVIELAEGGDNDFSKVNRDGTFGIGSRPGTLFQRIRTKLTNER